MCVVIKGYERQREVVVKSPAPFLTSKLLGQQRSKLTLHKRKAL